MLLDTPPDHLRLDEIAREIHANAFLNEVPIICLTTLAADGKIASIGFFSDYTFVAEPFPVHDLVAGHHGNAGRSAAVWAPPPNDL